MNSLAIEDIAGTLRGYFDEKENILFAFVFGSAVSGRLTDESDIDIAVLFEKTPAFSEVSNVTGEVSEALGRDADIVVLNNSSPVIRMQVLKHGKLLSCKNNALLYEFTVKTTKEYDDLKFIRKEAEEKILRGRIYA